MTELLGFKGQMLPFKSDCALAHVSVAVLCLWDTGPSYCRVISASVTRPAACCRNLSAVLIVGGRVFTKR